MTDPDRSRAVVDRPPSRRIAPADRRRPKRRASSWRWAALAFCALAGACNAVRSAAPPASGPTTTLPAGAASAVGSVPPAGSAAAVPPGAGALAPTRAPTRRDPLRVVVLGDSVMYDASPGVEAALRSTGVVRISSGAYFGVGLTSRSYDWRRLWTEAARRERAEVVVLLLGGWDQDEAVAKGAAWYAGLVDEAVAALAPAGLVWIGMPSVRPAAGSEAGKRFVNAVYAALPARYPGRVAYLDPDPVLNGPDGAYSRTLVRPDGQVVVARKPDDRHVCPWGAVRLGDAVWAAVAAAAPLPPPAPGWELGRWRRDPRYDDPPGGCPGR